MKRAYTFRWHRTSVDSVAPVTLENEPKVGEDVWVAGKKYIVVSVDRRVEPIVVVLEPPPLRLYNRKDPKVWR
jgi:hypothetical protein